MAEHQINLNFNAVGDRNKVRKSVVNKFPKS